MKLLWWLVVLLVFYGCLGRLDVVEQVSEAVHQGDNALS